MANWLRCTSQALPPAFAPPLPASSELPGICAPHRWIWPPRSHRACNGTCAASTSFHNPLSCHPRIGLEAIHPRTHVHVCSLSACTPHWPLRLWLLLRIGAVSSLCRARCTHLLAVCKMAPEAASRSNADESNLEPHAAAIVRSVCVRFCVPCLCLSSWVLDGGDKPSADASCSSMISAVVARASPVGGFAEHIAAAPFLALRAATGRQDAASMNAKCGVHRER